MSLENLDATNPPEALTVFEHAATPTSSELLTFDMSVNAANDLLYVIERYAQQQRLLRIDLDPDLVDTGGNTEISVVLSPRT